MQDFSTAQPNLPEIPGGWTAREVAVGGRRFHLTVPAVPDAFLDDAEVHAAHRRDDFMPYWPYLWPAARPTAEAVLSADWPPGTRVLEIGCGIGLVGLAALARGVQVTFSDYHPTAVELAVHNARQNGFASEGLLVDWRDPPPLRFPVVIGCDVVYEDTSHAPILDLLERTLEPRGFCWLGDGGRQAAERFVHRAERRAFHVKRRDETGQRLNRFRTGRFQVIVLTRRARRTGPSLPIQAAKCAAPVEEIRHVR